MLGKGPARIYNLISLIFILLSLGVAIFVIIQMTTPQ